MICARAATRKNLRFSLSCLRFSLVPAIYERTKIVPRRRQLISVIDNQSTDKISLCRWQFIIYCNDPPICCCDTTWTWWKRAELERIRNKIPSKQCRLQTNPFVHTTSQALCRVVVKHFFSEHFPLALALSFFLSSNFSLSLFSLRHSPALSQKKIRRVF
jgi:hypothetical protein